MKKTKLHSTLLALLVVLFYSCNKSSKDYSCKATSGTVYTDASGIQQTVATTDTRDCDACNSSSLDNYKKKGYICNLK